MSNSNHNQGDQNTNFMSSASKHTHIKRKKNEKNFMSSASKHTPMKRKKTEKKDEKFLNKNMLTPEICKERYSQTKSSIVDPQPFYENLTDPMQVLFPKHPLPLDEAIKMLETLK
ncbi:29471_t:CDS:2, partial [Racocetra persica]